MDDFWLHVETLRTDLLHDPNVGGIVLNTRDVSERKAFEEQLQHQAFHDSITGLANRALFRDRVEHAIARQARDDLPGRGPVHGPRRLQDDQRLPRPRGRRPAAGRGRRPAEGLRCAQADTAARLGGDEFAILLEDGGDGVDAAEVAERMMQRRSRARSTSRARRSSSARRIGIAIGRRTDRRDPRAPRSCCATPTSRCTWRRRPARAATRCSSPRCTTRRSSGWS